MHWLKLLGPPRGRKAPALRKHALDLQFETLEQRRVLSIDPVAVVAPETVSPDPVVVPLAVADQSIQSSWQADSTSTLSVSEHTGEKPQSKVWTYDGEWFAVLPNSTGTWIWRLDNGAWTPVLELSSSNTYHADVKPTGNITHVLLFDGGITQLASVQYVAATHSYEFWSQRPDNVGIALPGSTETATIDIDSQGRMWLAYDNKSAHTVEVRYSDGDYGSWSGPITVASGLATDDISAIVAMSTGQIGVFWSNQNTRRFGFRTHDDGADPNQWNAFEVPADQSALNIGHGMADDHMHLVCGSDGTIYAAVKTGYDSSKATEIGLLVRHPDGTWDPLYDVAPVGTRPIVVLNEQLGSVLVAYTEQDAGGKILYRETSTSSISFGPAQVLISGATYNNVTSTKQTFTDQILFVAATSSKVAGTLLINPEATPSAPVTNQPPQVSAGPDLSTQLGTPVALNASASDDGEPSGTLTLQWIMVSGPGSAFFGNTNVASTNVTFSAAGTYVLRLTASDGTLAASDDVTVTVTTSAPANQAPSVQAGSDLAGATGTPIQLAGAITDDGLPTGTLTSQWTLLSGPGLVNFADANAASTTATFSVAGSYVLRLTASDGALSSSDDVTVTVTTATSPGIVGFWNFLKGIGAGYPSEIGDLGSLQGGATVSTDGRLNLNGSGQQYVVPDMPELQISNAITITAWIKPSTGGTQYIVKKASSNSTDGFELGLSNSGTVFVRFNQASSGNSYRIDSSSKYPTNGNTWMHVAATYDGSTIRLYINGQEQASQAAKFTIATNNLPLSLGSGDSGSRTMQGQLDEVLVTDRALSAAEVSQVYSGGFHPTPPSAPVNQPPSVSAGSDQSTQVGVSFNLSGSVADDGQPSGSLLSNWSVVSGPGAVSFGNAASPTSLVTFSAAGTYVLRLTASDGDLSSSDDVTFVVAAASSPGIVGFWNFKSGFGAGYPSEIGDQGSLQGGATVTSNGRLNLNGSGQSYVVPDVPQLQIADAITITAWIKPSASGSQTVISKASSNTTDGFELGLSASGTVFVRFNQASSGDSYRVDSTSSYPTSGNNWMHVAATYDGSTIRLYINGQQQASLAASITIGTNNLPLTFGSDAGGANSMAGQLDEVLITDRALTAFEISQVYVGGFNPTSPSSVNQPPTVSAGPDLSGQTGVSISLNGLATDDGQPSGVLLSQWTAVSGPGSVDFGDASAVSTTATFSTAGTYVLRLTASDGALSSSDDVTVEVTSSSSPGLVGFWNFKQGIGAGYASEIGDQGSLQGGATVTSNGRLNLNGSGQSYVVPDGPQLQIADAITITAWIKPSASGSQTIVSKAGSNTTDGFELGLSASGTVFVRFNQASSGDTYRVDSSSSYPTDGNTWLHVAATYDGSTIRLYINGQEQASQTGAFSIGTNSLPLTFGADANGANSMVGQLDEVLITDRALSASEISKVYTGGFNPTP